MILATKLGSVETSLNNEVHFFKFKASAKAFDMWSSGLYSNKIQSVVRELSTNAWDSHQKACKENAPFVVHLPNMLEPFFSVRDNGVGLSEDDVLNLYSTYFDSDKTNSNKEGGCFGLGSKSPFCYTDNFSISSRFDGREKTYLIFVNEAGLPCITKVGDEPTDLENGFEVKLAVESRDFYQFQRDAEHVLSFFEPRPVVIGAADFKFKSEKFLINKPDYKLYETSQGKSFIVMGNVCYPFNHYDVDSTYGNASSIISHGLIVKLKIGEVEPSTNRESLQFTQKVKDKVKEVIAKVIIELKTDCETQIAAAKTLWEARLLYEKLRLSAMKQIYNFHNVIWKDSNGKEFDLSNVIHPQNHGVSINRMKKESYNDKIKNVTHNALVISEDVHYFICDDNQSISKVKFWMSENSENTVYLITRPLEQLLRDTVTNEFIPNENRDIDFTRWKKFLDETGLVDYKYTSHLPKPTRKQRSNGGMVTASPKTTGFYRFKLDTGEYDKVSNFWEQWSIDLKDTSVEYLYVHFDMFATKRQDGTECQPNVLTRIIRNLNTLTGKTYEVFGVNKLNFPKIEGKSNWKNLHEFVRETLKANKHILDEINEKEEYSEYNTNTWKYLQKWIGQFDDSTLKKLIEKDARIDNFDSDKHRPFIELNERYNAVRGKSVYIPGKYKAECFKVMRKYPMLNLARGNWKNTSRKLAYYIKTIDKQIAELRNNG